MIVGRGIFGYKGSAFKTVPYINKFYRLEVQNAIFDEIKIDDTVDMIYNSNKEDWGYFTLFDFKANGSLEAGNIDNKGVPIEKILFQKRKSDEFTWTDVAEFDFNFLQKIYSHLDTYIINDCPYEFCVVPLTNSITGNRTVQSFKPSFDGVFLTDKDVNIQLLLNMNLGDMEHVQGSYTYETLGSQFPIIGYSSLDYKKSSIKAMVVDTDDSDNNYLSPYVQKQKRDKILKFLKNHKPKLFRASNGEYLMIACINNPKFTPNNDLQGIVGDVNFDFVEIADTTETDMKNNGFI